MKMVCAYIKPVMILKKNSHTNCNVPLYIQVKNQTQEAQVLAAYE